MLLQDKNIAEAYNCLTKWNGKNVMNVTFKNHIMQGYIRKKVSTIKFFQKCLYPKRFL